MFNDPTPMRVRIRVLLRILACALAVTQQATSAEVDKCNVNVGKLDWTSAETFVWQKVCAGEEANFATTDAKTGKSRDKEQWASKPGNDWEPRTLRASFIETIALNDEFRAKLTRRGIQIVNARISGKLDLSNAVLKHELRFGACLFEDDVDLSGLQSPQLLDLMNSQFNARLDMNGIQIGGDLLMSDWRAHYDKVDLSGSTIGRNLDLSGATFEKDLDLKWTKIQGALILSKFYGPVKWSGKVALDGLTYSSVDSGDDISFLERWLASGGPSPQPYYQLATILQSQGDVERSMTIRYDAWETERASSSGWHWFWLTILKCLIGYGCYVWRALLWVGLFLLIGCEVLLFSGEGKRHHIGMAYCFDMLLPIVRLREEHYKIELGGCARQCFARQYFYLHQVIGFVLASFLIAGLAGLTK